MQATETISILVLAVSKYTSHINIAVSCICTMTLEVVYQANIAQQIEHLIFKNGLTRFPGLAGINGYLHMLS